MADFRILASLVVACVALSSAETPSAPEAASRENLQKLVLANNELAFSLLRSFISRSSENIFFSPFSISSAFAMLFYGARGETAKELRKALGYEKADLPDDLVSESFSRYLREVLKNGNSSNESVLKIASAMLVDKKFNIFKEYRRNVKKLFKAAIRNVNFAKESPRTVADINGWVKDKTNGKIEKILAELSTATVSVLLNAVYFKGLWETPFDPKLTRDEVFYNYGFRERSVPMMHLKSDFLYTFMDEFQALELPYKGENISMLILMPNQGTGLKDLEESLTPERLVEVQHQLYQRELYVAMPKFKLAFTKELSGDMQALGTNRIFKDVADFSGMTPSRKVKVSQIVHKAVIEVNEEGSEAAAVTGIQITGTKRTSEFRVEHPFLFAIVEKESNTILFMGSVNSL